MSWHLQTWKEVRGKMTVSEIIKCAEYLKHDDPALYNHLRYFEADWRAMREALERGINAYDAGGLARATLKTLRLKP